MKRRIQFVCVSMRPGGTERVVSKFANYACEQNDVAITLLASGENFYPINSAVRIFRPSFRKRSELGIRWYPAVCRHLSKSLSAFKPDIVLCFGEDIAPLVLLVASLCRQRCMVFNRASPAHTLSGSRRLIHPLFGVLAKSLVLQTEQARNVLKLYYPFTDLAVLPNPIELASEPPPVLQRQRRIVNVGTLGGRKGQADLIRSFAKASIKDEWSLLFVGDGPDRLSLEVLARDLGVGEAVTFAGETKAVREILEDSRIFAFPSRREGFPNALAEALAAGCACLSYDCLSGPGDMIEDGVSGLLVPNGNEVAFQYSLSRLARDDLLQERLGSAGRERISQFSAEKIFGDFSALIAGHAAG